MSTCPPCREQVGLTHHPQHPSHELSQRGDRGTQETPLGFSAPLPGSSPDDGGHALDGGHAGGERRGHRRLCLRQRDAHVSCLESPAVVGPVPAHPHAVAVGRREPVCHDGMGEKPHRTPYGGSGRGHEVIRRLPTAPAHKRSLQAEDNPPAQLCPPSSALEGLT